ncbi:MAG: hypothetical protein LUD72_12260 [Bacteroidales bacterium]|nr:hypothetical protein [Bacteroidales bacterium]
MILKYIIIAACILFGVATGNVDARPCAKCVVEGVLECMPTDNVRQLNRQMKRLAKIPEDGIRMISAKMLPAAQGGDNSVCEFALTSFANYVRDKGNSKLTAKAINGFFNAIGRCRGMENRGFLLLQAAQICGAEDIPRFEPYLENKFLAPYAESAVEYIKKPHSVTP